MNKGSTLSSHRLALLLVIGKDRPVRAGKLGVGFVALSDIDRKLLDRCLNRKPRAWEDFVDRYLGLVIHVINHSAQARSIRLSTQDREDLCGDVCLALVHDDFAVLRRFRGQSSLATYLTVIARRVVVKRLLASKSAARLATVPAADFASNGNHEDRVVDRDEVERLLEDLEGSEAQVVRSTISKAKATARSAPPPVCPRTASAPRSAGHAKSSAAATESATPIP